MFNQCPKAHLPTYHLGSLQLGGDAALHHFPTVSSPPSPTPTTPMQPHTFPHPSTPSEKTNTRSLELQKRETSEVRPSSQHPRLPSSSTGQVQWIDGSCCSAVHYALALKRHEVADFLRQQRAITEARATRGTGQDEGDRPVRWVSGTKTVTVYVVPGPSCRGALSGSQKR